jgi:Fe-S-cluster containining protein
VFPCTSCGLCCQNIGGIKELKEFDLGNGICKYFDFGNRKCSIYEDRPNICRVDKMFDLVYYKNFTRKDFYVGNAKVCNALQEQFNLDKSFRVKIGE